MGLPASGSHVRHTDDERRRAAGLSMVAASLAALLTATSAQAEMAITNLTKVNVQVVEKQGWSVRKERGRITLSCTGCREFTATDIRLDRATDGTEQRIRAGKMTAQSMLRTCKESARRTGGACYATRVANLKGAVGFVSDVGLGPFGYASTHTLWQDGRRLTIRSVAPSRQAARQNGQVMSRLIGAQIVR